MSTSLGAGEVRLWSVPAWADPDTWTTGQKDANSLIQIGDFSQISIAPDSQIDVVTVRPINANDTFVVAPGNPLPAGPWKGPVAIGAPYGALMVDTGSAPRNHFRLHRGVATTFTNSQNGKPCVANPRTLFSPNAPTGAGGMSAGPLLSLRLHAGPILDAAILRCPEATGYSMDLPATETPALAIPMMGRSKLSVVVGMPGGAANVTYRAMAYKVVPNTGVWASKQIWPLPAGTIAVAAGAIDTFTYDADLIDYVVILMSTSSGAGSFGQVYYEARD
jgi:hypothetical protein